MKVKVSYTKYKNSAGATFWSGLGAVFGYFLAPAGLLLIVWGGIHFNLHGFLAVLWGIACFAVTVLAMVGGVHLCDAMEMKCLQKAMKEIETANPNDHGMMSTIDDPGNTDGVSPAQTELQNLIKDRLVEAEKREKIQNVICPFCGEDIPSNSSYCCYCGKDISKQENLKTASSFTDPDWTLKCCPSCEAAIPCFMVYCNKCGKEQKLIARGRPADS